MHNVFPISKPAFHTRGNACQPTAAAAFKPAARSKPCRRTARADYGSASVMPMNSACPSTFVFRATPTLL